MTPNRSRFRVVHFAFAWLCAAVAACSPSIGSAQAGTTDAPYSAALRAAAIDGAARPVRIAETANGGTWSLHDQLLMFADGFGQIYADINLSERGYGTAQGFAVDPYDHSIWVATDARLMLHFATSGALLGGTSLTGDVGALAIGLDQTPWLLSEGTVIHLSTSATVLETYATLAKEDDPMAGLAVDSLRDQFWFATPRGVWRVPFGSAARADDGAVIIDEPRAIALDQRSGDLWILTTDEVIVVDHDGARRLSVEMPHGVLTGPIRLDYDDMHEGVVVRTATRALRIGRDGRIDDGPFDAAAIVTAAPFAIVPTVEMVRPPAGGATSDRVPDLTLRLGAQCNATRCAPPAYVDSITLDTQLDGSAASSRSIDAANGRIVIAPIGPLAAGSHRVTARASDRFGHHAQLNATITVLDRDASNPDPVVDTPASEGTLAPIRIPKAANKSPSVVLTSPASGTTYTAGTNVALAATANDPDGVIAKLEFYRNGSLLIGTVSSSPYQLTWPNVSAGNYTLSAKAYDNRNGTATSAPVTITVLANKPPAVTMTQPIAGAFYGEGSTIAVAAAASDGDGSVVRVEFLDGTAVVGAATAAPFAISWTGALAGDHAIAARAIDDKGAATVSASVGITIGEAPLVVVKGPLACSVVDAGAALVLNADAISTHGSIASVEFFDNGTSVGTAFTEPWTVTLSQPTTGSHMITARATDDHGLEAQSRAAAVTVSPANQAPIVTITSPIEGSRFASGSPVNLTAVASDADGFVSAVEYRLNDSGGTLVGRSTSPPFPATWPDASAGSYAIVAVATDDRAAKTTSTAVHVSIDANVVPSVSIIAPVANSVYKAPATIVLSASATDRDGSIAKIDYFAGGAKVGSANAAPYTSIWSNVAAGSYVLTAQATDNRGATSTSAPVPIVVTTNSPPSITLRPLGGEDYFAPASIVLNADASDSDGTIARVEFRANGAIVGVATAAPYSYAWNGIGTGSYSITATAVDDQGATTTTAPMSATIEGPLAVAMSPGLDGATVRDDHVLIRGVVSAPLNSAMTINGVVAHIDDFGQFQANDIPLEPGANTVTAVVTTQDGQTTSHAILVNSTGRGALVTHAAPTEGLSSLVVRFTVENPDDVAFNRITFDLDDDGIANVTATPAQFVDGILNVSATYSTGTWIAVITAYDDRDQVIYSTRKSIVVLSPAALQAKLMNVYDGMLGRLRVGNVTGALTAFTATARDRYAGVLSQLQTALPSIIAEIGELKEFNFGMDLAELSVVRTTQAGSEQFMLYMLRSEDGIWRFDGM